MRKAICSFVLSIVLVLHSHAGAQEHDAIELVGRVLFGNAEAVHVVDDLAYVCAGSALLIFDVS